MSLTSCHSLVIPVKLSLLHSPWIPSPTSPHSTYTSADIRVYFNASTIEVQEDVGTVELTLMSSVAVHQPFTVTLRTSPSVGGATGEAYHTALYSRCMHKYIYRGDLQYLVPGCMYTYTHVLTCFQSEVVRLFACNCKTYVRNTLVPLQLWPFSAAAVASTFVVVTFLQLMLIFSQVTIMPLFKQEIQQ